MTRKTAGKAGASLRDDLASQTRSDPGLSAAERETTITWASDEDHARIHTEAPALIRRCLAHDALDVDAIGVYDGDTTRRVEFDTARANGGVDGDVVALSGRVSIAHLSIKTSRRNHTQQADVISEGVFSE